MLLKEWQQQIQVFMADGLCKDADGPLPQIGGHGSTVKIDETLLNRGKKRSAPFARARACAGWTQIWLWGAVVTVGPEQGTFIGVMLNSIDQARGAIELKNVLLRTLRPGTRVIHDDWGAYRHLRWLELPFEHDPLSCVFAHKNEIKNAFGEHTNEIEGVWGVLKRWLRKRHGGRIPKSTTTLELEIWEFMWRQRTPPSEYLSAFLRLMPS